LKASTVAAAAFIVAGVLLASGVLPMEMSSAVSYYKIEKQKRQIAPFAFAGHYTVETDSTFTTVTGLPMMLENLESRAVAPLENGEKTFTLRYTADTTYYVWEVVREDSMYWYVKVTTYYEASPAPTPTEPVSPAPTLAPAPKAALPGLNVIGVMLIISGVAIIIVNHRRRAR